VPDAKDMYKWQSHDEDCRLEELLTAHNEVRLQFSETFDDGSIIAITCMVAEHPRTVCAFQHTLSNKAWRLT
jgi:hypothetical protein